jgi:hypothetical protein
MLRAVFLIDAQDGLIQVVVQCFPRCRLHLSASERGSQLGLRQRAIRQVTNRCIRKILNRRRNEARRRNQKGLANGIAGETALHILFRRQVPQFVRRLLPTFFLLLHLNRFLDGGRSPKLKMMPRIAAFSNENRFKKQRNQAQHREITLRFSFQATDISFLICLNEITTLPTWPAESAYSASRRNTGIEPPLFDELPFGVENPQHAALFL